MRRISYPTAGSARSDTAVPRINPPALKPISTGGSPPDTFTLQFLFGGAHGRHLEPFIVCHSHEVQPDLDSLQIARGVQWELVRGVTANEWTWDDVRPKLRLLQGTNEKIAPAVRSIMLGTPSREFSPHEQALWEELDREVKATVENKSRGLGLMGEFDGVPDYYGGKIQCTIRLLSAADGEPPKVRLEPLQMTRSNHLARELGSVSVIALRDDKDGAVVKQWAGRKFILCGRTYLALPPKSSKVYLIETAEDFDRVSQPWCGDEHRMSYDDYIRKNNPMPLNANQPFAKYLTRLNLYLSTSIPVLIFPPENIHFIDDLYGTGWTKAQNPPTETIMTDGCGFINRTAALMINTKLKYDRTPVAFQGRIAGSKGMWVIDPTDKSPEPHIWIRDSQRKIHFTRLVKAQRIFDLLAASSPSSALHLSAQSIVILSNNGVPSSVFCALQEKGLQELIAPLMDWHRMHATAYLWDAVNNIAGVTRSRVQRLAVGASRALGLEKRAFDDDVNLVQDPNDAAAGVPQLALIGKNTYNGEPLVVAEYAMDLLQAGFDPRFCATLSKKIHTFIKTTMETYLTRYRLPLATSLEAYIIPDPTGLLREGEVFYKSSKDSDGALREEVVVGRYPMRESSDMQKVTAVDIPALAEYLDVLVTSIQGSRSLASLLAGGDTDGDEAIIIRDPAIVGAFKNRPFVPIPNGFLAENFERQVETVTDFGMRLECMPTLDAQRAFQNEVVGGLRDGKLIGIYSLFHDAAVYEWGLDDAKTRRMAHMTTTLLDASKTGLRLKSEVKAADDLTFSRIPRPKCFDSSKGEVKTRSAKLGSFVLDALLAAGKVTRDQLQAKFENTVASHLKPGPEKPDDDLEHPYHRVVTASVGETPLAVTLAQDLNILRLHIQDVRVKFDDARRQFARTKSKDSEPRQQWEMNQSRRKGRPKGNDYLLPLMREFRRTPPGVQVLHLLGNLDHIKASYAASLGYSFGFNMAFRELCEIKREAEMGRGQFNRVAVIDDAKSMGGPSRRLLKHIGE
ncbi:RNA dependent RNA polymerase-domain-containing protein [Mycena filopes]|nr:RNA dependent RNA polymerase-domain-containing protein [Mycena filopes]